MKKLFAWISQGAVIGLSALLTASLASIAWAAFDFTDMPTNVSAGSTLSATAWNDLVYRVNGSVKGASNFQSVDAANQTPTMTCASWCDVTNVSASLPSAGTYVVIFSADGYRSGGTRGDTSQIRLAWTGGNGKPRSVSGENTLTSQSHGDITLIQKITVSGPDTVRVQVQDPFGAAIQPYYGQFLFFKID